MARRRGNTVSMLLFLQLICLKASTASKPRFDCPKKCGNTDIPYPFGIVDPDCVLNEAFNLTCNNSSDPPKVFWGGLEVLQISLLQGEMIITTGISYDCYNSAGSTDHFFWSFYLGESWPFTYSATRNKFTAIGCDTEAYIEGSWGRNFTSGCVSYCTDFESLTNGSCSGIGCCQTAIPKGVKKVDMPIRSYAEHEFVLNFNPCSYAFLVEESNYSFFVSDMGNGSLKSRMSTVPTVLEWAIKNETCESAKHAADYACVSNNSYCYDSDNGYRCNCSRGYEGNPYFVGGCKDIDECSVDNGCQQFCTNLPPGSYTCSCWNGYHLNQDGKTCIENPPKQNVLPVLKIVLGIGLSLLIILCASTWSYWAWRKRKLMKAREKFFRQNGGLLLQEKISSRYSDAFKIFTTDEMENATDNYNESRIVGQGGYGTVYKGILSDKKIIAIKKSKIVDKTQIEQFINEVHILSQINHRNVVKILGCCLEAEVPLLVYEFVSNGTLFQHIHGEECKSSISLETRLRIAAETASALCYLHSAASIPIFHRDVKSTNILLDNNFTAKVSDFGASRLVPLDQTQIATLVQGTLGYLDPEYFHTGQFTEKSDVYSFGVVLVELLTGETPISTARCQAMRSLSSYFLSSMKENELFKVLERRVQDEGTEEQLVALAELAERCLNLKGEERPSMQEVVMELERLRRLHQHPWDLKKHGETESLLGEPPRGYTGNSIHEYSMVGNIMSELEMGR